nr:PREDICTED: uncharacterized protein LOC106705981 [Latimeria chalumnae]|eukprot:XP_014351707.1 PREDICTED: uncharacterized protein LOC106705981 [Latimeria chalumnae]
MHCKAMRHLEERGCDAEPGLLFCLPDQVASAGSADGTLHSPVKPAKLDATALQDDTLAAALPPSEQSEESALACGTGINEEHYVSEAVDPEDVPSHGVCRDACTITGTYRKVSPSVCLR